MSERWRPTPGWPGYEVSDHGRVRSLTRVINEGRTGQGWAQRTIAGQVMRPTVCKSVRSGRIERLVVTLSKDGKKRPVGVHLLVLEAFVGPRPEDQEGCHNDGDVTNNHLSNLRWDTRVHNFVDKILHGSIDMSLPLPKQVGRPLTSALLAGWSGCV